MKAPTFPQDGVPDDPQVARLVGLYPQRQEGLWMQRLKVLGGSLTPAQWRGLARICRTYTPTAPLHLTTRQDIELHEVASKSVRAVQRAIAGLGLTGLGACGDTLRNVTVCPCAGLAEGSVDLIPLAWRIRRELEGLDGVYDLPRKFKIALACGPTCGQPWLNGLAFIARKVNGRWGFRATGAGSLGPRPAMGIPLSDSIEPADVLPLAISAVKFFALEGDRENRSRARWRHVRQRLGDEAFQERLREGFEREKARRAWPDVSIREVPNGFPARVTLTFANGDVTAEAADALGELGEPDDVGIRIAGHHRIAVFGRSPEQLQDRIGRLEALSDAAAPQAAVVACPGTRWCKRAIAETNGPADRLRRRLGARGDGLRICISGCPNGCAHSRIADVGLTGGLASHHGGKREVFDVYVGGGAGRDPRLARRKERKLPPEEAIEAALRYAEELTRAD